MTPVTLFDGPGALLSLGAIISQFEQSIQSYNDYFTSFLTDYETPQCGQNHQLKPDLKNLDIDEHKVLSKFNHLVTLLSCYLQPHD